MLQDIAQLIKEHYSFFETPSLDEVDNLLKAAAKQNIKKTLTESELDSLVELYVKNRMHVVNASVDMSGSTSILMQILNAAKTP